MPTTLKEYQDRFDLDGEGGDLLSETARASIAWLGTQSEGNHDVRRILKRWLHVTGCSPCLCPACKRKRGEALDDEDLAYEASLGEP